MILSRKRPLLRGPAFTLVIGCLLALIGVLGTVFAVWSSRNVALRQWEARLGSTALMLTAHATQSLGAADLMLRGADENLKKYRFENEDDLRAVASSERITSMLQDAAAGLPQVAGLGIIARDGTILNLSGQPVASRMKILDREYIQAHIDEPELEHVLSKTIINQLTHEPRFFLARKIRSANGTMIGVLAAGLRPEFFSDFYTSSGLGVSQVTLFRKDGSALVRVVSGITDLSGDKLLPEVLHGLERSPQGVALGGQKASTHSFERMTAYETSNQLPIGISISASSDQILQEWKNQTIIFVMSGGALTALLIISTLLLARLVSQLEKARNAALAAADAKTRFVANVSHELRTPMNAIIGGSHQILQASLTEEPRRFAQMVSSAAQQLMVLINDILDFSYYETRNFRIEKAPLGLHQLARESIEMARALVSDKKLQLEWRVDQAVPDMVIGDSGRIKQVLLNLLGNAVKFTEDGVVELRLSYLAPRDLLVLQVCDTGPGILAEDQRRIFEPFERTQLGSKKPGTGLGLTICKKLVEAMGGDIKLWSEPGQGTRFTVEIPAPAARPEQVAAMIRAEAEPTAARHFPKPFEILVAEDVMPSRMLLTMMLENMGHKVTAVENGLDAVKAAKENAFDLILMDLQMPEMDGITATKRIRAQGGPSESARILAVSANSDIDGPNGLASAGFDDSLLKPVTPERLSFVIGALTGRH